MCCWGCVAGYVVLLCYDCCCVNVVDIVGVVLLLTLLLLLLLVLPDCRASRVAHVSSKISLLHR